MEHLDAAKQTWRYRGEGNANVVIALPERRQVIRIAKGDDQTTGDTMEQKGLEFHNRIMTKLLTAAFVPSGTQAYLYNTTTMDKDIERIRPNHRKHKSLQYNVSTLFPDCALLPTELKLLKEEFLIGSEFAVEIKPKQGWIPISDRHAEKCQFCMNQHVKLKDGRIEKLSGYCPMDLFSGVKSRMRKAVQALIVDPQNNFKIFADGNLVYADSHPVEQFYKVLHKMQSTCTDDGKNIIEDIILEALLWDVAMKSSCPKCSFESQSKSQAEAYGACNLSKSRLPENCVLNKLLSLQKMNKGFDQYYNNYKENQQSKNYDYIEDVLKVESTDSGCLKCLLEELPFVPYLIASVANDCSIMITFQVVQENALKRFPLEAHRQLIKVNSTIFLVNIRVLDLYPKPLQTIKKHKLRDVQIKNCF